MFLILHSLWWKTAFEHLYTKMQYITLTVRRDTISGMPFWIFNFTCNKNMMNTIQPRKVQWLEYKHGWHDENRKTTRALSLYIIFIIYFYSHYGTKWYMYIPQKHLYALGILCSTNWQIGHRHPRFFPLSSTRMIFNFNLLSHCQLKTMRYGVTYVIPRDRAYVHK